MSLRQDIYEQLVEDILRGRIHTGEKLVETELAKKFNVSRTPVREALLQLEKEGYTEHVKNVGATVKKISPRKVGEIFEVIAILESEAAAITVGAGVAPEELAHLRGLQEGMVQSAGIKDYIRYGQLNIQFHQFFLDRCGNETLSTMGIDLRNKMYRMVSEGLSLPMNIEKYLQSHDQVLAAVTEKKPDSARRWMREHIYQASRGLVQMMIQRYE